jgi:hypothetical protein
MDRGNVLLECSGRSNWYIYVFMYLGSIDHGIDLEFDAIQSHAYICILPVVYEYQNHNT